MFFFGKNLKRGHKVTLCLLLLGVLANVYLFANAIQIPFVEIQEEESVAPIVEAFGTFVKWIVLFVFEIVLFILKKFF